MIAVSPRSRVGQDRQDRPVGMGQRSRSWSTPSKSAEPTRTKVAPSSMAVSKSFDIPIDSSASGRPVSRLSRLASSRSRTNDSRAVSAVVPSAAIVIKPTIGIASQAAIDSASLKICSAVQPCLLGSSEVLTCRQTPGGSLRLAAASFEGSQQLERVDRMNHPHHAEVFS